MHCGKTPEVDASWENPWYPNKTSNRIVHCGRIQVH